MSKIMQNVIFIIEEPSFSYSTPEKIGFQYMNRIAIDEEASFEIRKVSRLPIEILPKQSRGLVTFPNNLFDNFQIKVSR